MDDELKKLLEELEKLMELNNKEEIKDKIDELMHCLLDEIDWVKNNRLDYSIWGFW